MAKIKRLDKPALHPDFGVDSRYDNNKKRLSDGKQLMEARLNRLNKLRKNEIVKARLLQLKLQMEAYVDQSIHQKQNYFTNFLANYIDAIYDKRNMFAKDISITPVSLSQILNNHRQPSEAFMLRLMIHSELAFKRIANFEKQIWYRVYYHEKLRDTMANQDEWASVEKKYVKIKYAVLE